jgi:hypothetical protein
MTFCLFDKHHKHTLYLNKKTIQPITRDHPRHNGRRWMTKAAMPPCSSGLRLQKLALLDELKEEGRVPCLRGMGDPLPW